MPKSIVWAGKRRKPKALEACRRHSHSIKASLAELVNYPNPFNPTTVIRYELPSNSRVKVQVFDVLGRVVSTVVNEQKEAGIYEVVFNASSLSSGTYFYRLQAGSATNGASLFVETKKMVLVK